MTAAPHISLIVPRAPSTVRGLCVYGRLRGGSQADLTMTDRGLYVVKWQQNAQHRRVLINEAFGALLLRRLGIDTPPWALVYADERLIANSPCSVIQTESGPSQIQPGWHFGSRVPKSTSGPSDLLPSMPLHSVINKSDFVRAFVLDRWVDNNDGRQAILFRSGRNRLLRAQMIDNGHCFGGVEWRLRETKAVNMSSGMAKLCIAKSAKGLLNSTIRAIQAISVDSLRGYLGLLPEEWLMDDRPSIHELFETLIMRAQRLPEIVAGANKYLIEQWNPDSMNVRPSSRYCRGRTADNGWN